MSLSDHRYIEAHTFIVSHKALWAIKRVGLRNVSTQIRITLQYLRHKLNLTLVHMILLKSRFRPSKFYIVF